jgi:hypothetical protein
MSHIRHYLLAAAAVAAAIVLAPPDAAAMRQPQDLTGVWILNAAESDTIGLPVLDAERRRSIRFRIGWSAGASPYRSISDPARMRRAVEAVRDAPDRIFLVRTDTTAVLSFDAEPPVTLWTDGREVVRVWPDGETVTVRAQWKDGTLRITRELKEDLEVTETYRLSGRRLVVRTIVEGPIPRRIELRRVYEPAPGG